MNERFEETQFRLKLGISLPQLIHTRLLLIHIALGTLSCLVGLFRFGFELLMFLLEKLDLVVG